jgi:hypothetical protein
MEVKLNGRNGEVTVQYKDDNKEKVATEHLRLPADLANGLTLTLLKNISPDAAETKVGFVAPTPKPKLVKLVITSRGEEPFATGDAPRKAMHYVVKVEIGGLSGVFASLLGKEPPGAAAGGGWTGGSGVGGGLPSAGSQLGISGVSPPWPPFALEVPISDVSLDYACGPRHWPLP